MTAPVPASVYDAAVRLWIWRLPLADDEVLVYAWARRRWPLGVPIVRQTLALWVLSAAVQAGREKPERDRGSLPGRCGL